MSDSASDAVKRELKAEFLANSEPRSAAVFMAQEHRRDDDYPPKPPAPAAAAAPSHHVGIDHFRPRQKERRGKRKRAEFDGTAQFDVNPAAASKHLFLSNALALTDASGRMFWDACDEANSPNDEWIRRLKESVMYEAGDCILIARSSSRSSEAREYATFPNAGETHDFLTTRPLQQQQAGGSTGPGYRQVTADIAYVSAHETGYAARKTCYLLIAGGVFTYN